MQLCSDTMSSSVFSRIRVLFTACSLLLAVSACGGNNANPATSGWDVSGDSTIALQASGQMGAGVKEWNEPQQPVIPPKEFAAIPEPSLVRGLVASSRGQEVSAVGERREASYVDGSQIGSTFWTYLNVTYHNQSTAWSDGTYLTFLPKWSTGGPSQIAYKMYQWQPVLLSSSTIMLNWMHPPSGSPGDPQWSDSYVGLVNVPLGRWDWYLAPDNGVLNLPSFTPYLDSSGNILMNVVCTGNVGTRLINMRIGLSFERGVGGPEFNADVRLMVPSPFRAAAVPLSCDLSAVLPTAGHQGTSDSCITWAIVDGALNFEMCSVYAPYGWDAGNSLMRPSPRYAFVEAAYLHDEPLPVTSDTRPAPHDFMVGYGTSSEQATPWNWPNASFDDRIYTPQALTEVPLMDIEDYWQFESEANQPEMLEDIRTILANHRRPVCVLLDVDQQFVHYFPEATDPPEIWTYSGPDYASHAVLIVGYDDSLQAVKFRNSYGTLWGYDGYGWMSYECFEDIDCSVSGICCVKDEYDLDTANYFLQGIALNRPPQLVQATAGTHSDRIVVEWEAVPNALSYDLIRDIESNVVVSVMAPGHSFSDFGAADGLSHAYWVKVYYPGGLTAISRPDIGFTWNH